MNDPRESYIPFSFTREHFLKTAEPFLWGVHYTLVLGNIHGLELIQF